MRKGYDLNNDCDRNNEGFELVLTRKLKNWFILVVGT